MLIKRRRTQESRNSVIIDIVGWLFGPHVHADSSRPFGMDARSESISREIDRIALEGHGVLSYATEGVFS